jgi:hypothetical protein
MSVDVYSIQSGDEYTMKNVCLSEKRGRVRPETSNVYKPSYLSAKTKANLTMSGGFKRPFSSHKYK